MSTPKMIGPFKEEDYKLFKEAFKKALFNNEEYFQFRGTFYLTQYAKQLIKLIKKDEKYGQNERNGDRDP